MTRAQPPAVPTARTDMTDRLEGIILKGIGGFYYVEAAGEVYTAKARGVFRKEGTVPLAGDRVEILTAVGTESSLDKILPRKNELLRPPVANTTTLVIVVSSCEPQPVPLVIDKLTAIAVNRGIAPVVVFTKTDLAPVNELFDVYKSVGFPTYSVSSETGEGVEAVREYLYSLDGITVFCGNSGVGKSTLLNAIDGRFSLLTGEISHKLGRGRHTTRETELFKLGNGYVADTPGFSALDFQSTEKISKENLPFCFPEFLPYLGSCRFSTCSHTVDRGCKILEAVENGIIPESRLSSYKSLYEEAKNVADWELNVHNK